MKVPLFPRTSRQNKNVYLSPVRLQVLAEGQLSWVKSYEPSWQQIAAGAASATVKGARSPSDCVCSPKELQLECHSSLQKVPKP